MIPRLYLSYPLTKGAILPIKEEEVHYLAHVLRREANDEILVFNGKDGEYRATIMELGKRQGNLRLLTRTREQKEEAITDLWLCFTPLKKEATDFLIEKGTELGVARFQPITTRRARTERLNPERWQRNAQEASEQCERLSLPTIAPLLSFERLISEWPHDRLLLICSERGNAAPMRPALEELTGQDKKIHSWAILIGPEGGFAEDELDLLTKLPFAKAIGLGPRILRAESAALAALSIFQSIIGDGSLPSPKRP